MHLWAGGNTRICDEQVHASKTSFPDIYPKKEQSFLSGLALNGEESRPSVNVSVEFQHPRGFLNQIASGPSNRTLRRRLAGWGPTVEPQRRSRQMAVAISMSERLVIPAAALSRCRTTGTARATEGRPCRRHDKSFRAGSRRPLPASDFAVLW